MVRGEPQVRIRRPLIGTVDSGEVGDLSGACLGIQTLGIAAFAVGQRGVDEHLEEFDPGVGVNFSGKFAVLGQRTDCRNQHGQPGVGHQGRDVRQAAQVLGAVGHREPEVRVEAVSQVVPVENVGGTPMFEQRLFGQDRDRGLARTGQAGEPQRAPLSQPLPRRHQGLVAHRVRGGRPGGRRRGFAHHAGRDSHIGVRVDQDERPGGRVAGVLVEHQRHLGAQAHPAEFVEFERGSALVAVQGVDVEAVVQSGDAHPGGPGGVLDDVVPAGFECCLVGHPADHRVKLGGGVGLVLRARQQIAAGDVDVIGQADRDRHRRKGLRHRALRPVNGRDATGPAAGQDDHFIAGSHDAAGHGPGVAAMVGMLTGLGADDVLNGESDVDQVAVTGDVDVLEMAQQRRPVVPGRLIALGDDVVTVQCRHRDGGDVMDV